MKYISRKLYEGIISDANARKALALLIYVKHNYPTSVIPNYSHYKLSKLTGIHQTTIKKYIKILSDYRLVEYVGNKKVNLRFNKIRKSNRFLNIKLNKIDYSSVKNIAYFLQLTAIVEVQNRKDYIRQLCVLSNDPKRGTKVRQIKSARRKLKQRGIDKFVDNGISYKYICDKLKCSRKTVANIIEKGEFQGVFIRNKNIQQIFIPNIGSYAKYTDFRYTFCTKDNLYIIGANTYTLL